jgi:hypothetical protein
MPAYDIRYADVPFAGYHLARRQYKCSVDGGEESTITLFTVTGTCYVQIIGVSQVTPVAVSGTPTMAVGISGNTTAMIATTNSANITQYSVWESATITAHPSAVTLELRSFVVTNGADIILTLAGAHINSGTIDFYCTWLPLSAGASVVAA